MVSGLDSLGLVNQYYEWTLGTDNPLATNFRRQIFGMLVISYDSCKVYFIKLDSWYCLLSIKEFLGPYPQQNVIQTDNTINLAQFSTFATT